MPWLFELTYRRHHLEDGGHDLAGQVAEGVDHSVDVIVLEIARPDIDEAVRGVAGVAVGMEVDRGDPRYSRFAPRVLTKTA